MTSALVEVVSRQLASRGQDDGFFTTAVDGMHIIRLSEETLPNGVVYKPSLCITVQGMKEVAFGEAVFDYGEMGFLLVAVEMPAFGRVTKASKERPYLCITIDLDIGVLREVMDQLDEPPVPSNNLGIGVFASPLDGGLADCVGRLVRLLDNLKAIAILQPMIMREICFWLLTGPYAGEICKLVLPNSHMQRVAAAIFLLRENFTKPVRIEHLAAAARMSATSFHQHFKTLTSMTPLQYQKQLRLLEARRLMASNDVSVSHAAFQVGYESPSQFSREYARMFGTPPKRDLTELKSVAV